MKALWLVAITTILTACSDSSTITGNADSGLTGDGSDQTNNENSVSGQWTGSLTNSATLLESCGTESAPFTMDVTQTGTAITANASLDCIGTAIVNQLNGTVSGSEILLTDAYSRDTYTLTIDSSSAISGTVVDTTETNSADIQITR